MSQDQPARFGYTAVGRLPLPTTPLEQLVQMPMTMPRDQITISLNLVTKVIKRPTSFELLLAAGYDVFSIELAHCLTSKLVNTAAGDSIKSDLNSQSYHLVQDGSLVEFALQIGHGAFTVNHGNGIHATSTNAIREGEVLLQTSTFNILEAGDHVWVSESGLPASSAVDAIDIQRHGP